MNFRRPRLDSHLSGATPETPIFSFQVNQSWESRSEKQDFQSDLNPYIHRAIPRKPEFSRDTTDPDSHRHHVTPQDPKTRESYKQKREEKKNRRRKRRQPLHQTSHRSRHRPSHIANHLPGHILGQLDREDNIDTRNHCQFSPIVLLSCSGRACSRRHIHPSKVER